MISQSNYVRRMLRKILRIILICLMAVMVYDRILYRLLYVYLQPTGSSFAHEGMINYRITPFLILFELVQLLRDRLEIREFLSKGDRIASIAFECLKAVLLLWAFCFWAGVEWHNFGISTTDRDVQLVLLFAEEASDKALTKFGVIILLVYLAEALTDFAVCLKRTWDADPESLKKLRTYGQILLCKTKGTELTKPRLLLHIAEYAFFVYAFAYAFFWDHVHYIRYFVQGLDSPMINYGRGLLGVVLMAPYAHLWLFAVIRIVKYGFIETDG